MRQFPIFAKSDEYEQFDNEDKQGLSRGVQLSRDKMIAYKHILKLAGYSFAR